MSLKPQALAFEDRWSDVKSMVSDVLEGKSVDKKIWTSCFSDIYALCTAFPVSHAPRLYKEVKSLFTNYVQAVLETLQSLESENVLKQYCVHWETYSTACYATNSLFSYMNTQCMKQHGNSHSDQKAEDSFIEDFLVINDLGLRIWSEGIIMKMKDKLASLVLGDIHSNRLGNFIEVQEVILKTINSFKEAEKYKGAELGLKLYESSLEEPYLQQVMDYYRQKSLHLVDTLSVPEYISKCLQLLDEEGWRAKRFMTISYDKILEAVRQMLTLDHLDFINSNCKAMIEAQNEDGLGNAYLLLNFSSKAISHLINEYQNYVERMCMDVFKAIKDDNAASSLCESLVDIHEDQVKLMRKVFHSHPGFMASLDKGFNSTINKLCRSNGPPSQKSAIKISPVPDLLVKYCDQLLKKATKGLNENDLDDKLAGAITIFKYLEDKDVFNKIYSKLLARRLIFSLSQSMDAEETMIKKLTQVCGNEYTSKLQRMLTDVKISEDLTSKFLEQLDTETQAPLGLSFNILIMQTCSWPLQLPQSKFNIPQELERSLQLFEKFYQLNFKGRKLIWFHVCSTCELKLNHLNRPYVMQTSLHIMSILVLFNASPSLSFNEISMTTGIPADDLLRSLQLVVDGNLLLCDTGDKVDPESRFSVNCNYQNKRSKFKLVAPFRESVQEAERTLNTVSEDRKMFLQAVIVRTMKARKRMNHKALIDEVVQQSIKHFVPSTSFIKRMIEQLIDKQYIERVNDLMEEYNYVS